MTTATVAQTPKIQTADRACWFEFNLDLVECVKRNRPDRIFASDDPMWEQLRTEKRMNRGTLCVGSYTRVGDEFVNGTVKTEMTLICAWEAAQEKMRLFEIQNGRMWDTPQSDAIKERGEKDEQARSAPQVAAEAFAKAIEPLVNAVTAKESRR